jgi:drug/metabolite transporter (DMT)-like permease
MIADFNLAKFNLAKNGFFSDPQKRAIAALLVIVIATAFNPILVKLAEQEMSPNAVVFHRLWIASITLGLVKGIQIISEKKSIQIPTIEAPPNSDEFPTHQFVLLVAAAGLSFGTTTSTWAWSLPQTSVANSTLLHSVTPVFITLLGFFVLGRRFDGRFITGMIIAMGGSSLLEIDGISYELNTVRGDALALLSALLFAAYLMCVERLRRQLDVLTISVCCCFVGSLVNLFTLLGQIDISFLPSWTGWIEVTGLGWINALNVGLTVSLLNVLSSEFVAVALLISPVITALSAWIVFAEPLGGFSLLAFPMVLLGIYLTIKSQTNASDEQAPEN